MSKFLYHNDLKKITEKTRKIFPINCFSCIMYFIYKTMALSRIKELNTTRIGLLTCLLILTLPALGCCTSPSVNFQVKNVDHSHPSKFSCPTPQTQLSEAAVEMLRQKFPGKMGLEKIGEILRWMRMSFERYRGRGKWAAKRSAQQIFDSRRLSGCNDWGILLTAILRSLGYPVVFMNAAGIEWARLYRSDPSVEFSGHVFLEIFINSSWIVMDSVTGEYIEDYDFKDPVIPIPKKKAGERGYFVYQKGLDHWSMGVTSIEDNKKIMRDFALLYPLDSLTVPEKKIQKILPSSKKGSP